MTEGELAELLRSVIARPDDHDVLRIYADALLERDDPRGELIAIQLQRRFDAAEDLVAREREVIARLEATLAAELGQPGTTTAWRHGFLDAIDFTPRPDAGRLVDSLRALGTLPAARRLRRIVIRFVEPGWGASSPIVAALTRLAPQFRALRELAFTEAPRGQAPDPAPHDVTSNFGDLATLTRAVPRLEVLELATTDYAAFRDLHLPCMRRFVLEHPSTYGVQALGYLRAPELGDLEIHGGRWRFADLERALGRDLPLRRLVLVITDRELLQQLCRAVPDAPLFRGVHTFTLAGAPLDATCVDYLVHHAAHLRRLRRFEIAGAVELPRLEAALGACLAISGAAC